MRNFLQLSTLLTLSLALCVTIATAAKPNPSELTVLCNGQTFNPGDTATCPEGLVVITGTGYPKFSNFTVENESGIYDQPRQEADADGNVVLPEGLRPAGTYTVTYKKGQVVKTVTILVTPVV